MITKLDELKYKSFCNKLRQHINLAVNGHTFAADVTFIIDDRNAPCAKIVIDSAFPPLTQEYIEALPLPRDLEGMAPRIAQIFSAAINQKLKIAISDQYASEKQYMVILVDGNNLAHRCKHVYRLSYQGQDTSIQYGVLRSLTAIWKKFNPYRIVVCFDQGFPAKRRELVPSYKISRHKDESDDYLVTREQISMLYDFLPRFGIFTSRLEGYEADDLIAQYCSYLQTFYQKESQRTLVVSGDKDLYQLVSERVDVSDPMKLQLVTTQNFEEITGVPSQSYLLYRSLVGDDSDEVPGVYGIGPVKAANIIKKYPTLTALRLGLLKHSVPELNSFELKSLMKLIKDTYECIDLHSDFAQPELINLWYIEEPLKWKTVEAELLLRGFTSLVTDSLFREMVQTFNGRHGLVGIV